MNVNISARCINSKTQNTCASEHNNVAANSHPQTLPSDDRSKQKCVLRKECRKARKNKTAESLRRKPIDSALETTPKVANRVGVGRKTHLHAALPIPNRKSRRTWTRKRSRSEESSPPSAKVKSTRTRAPRWLWQTTFHPVTNGMPVWLRLRYLSQKIMDGQAILYERYNYFESSQIFILVKSYRFGGTSEDLRCLICPHWLLRILHKILEPFFDTDWMDILI